MVGIKLEMVSIDRRKKLVIGLIVLIARSFNRLIASRDCNFLGLVSS